MLSPGGDEVGSLRQASRGVAVEFPKEQQITDKVKKEEDGKEGKEKKEGIGQSRKEGRVRSKGEGGKEGRVRWNEGGEDG